MRNDLVNTGFGTDGLTPLQSKIAEGFPTSCIPSMKLIAERGRQPTLCLLFQREYGARFPFGATVRHDIATSLSMRRSAFFFQWRQLLRELNSDFGVFVQKRSRSYLYRGPGGNKTRCWLCSTSSSHPWNCAGSIVMNAVERCTAYTRSRKTGGMPSCIE